MAPVVPIVSTTHSSNVITPYNSCRPPPIVPVSDGVLCAVEQSPLALMLLVVPVDEEEDEFVSSFERGETLDLKPGLDKMGWKDEYGEYDNDADDAEDEEEVEEVGINCLEQCETQSRAEGEWVVVGLSNGDCVMVEIKKGRVLWFKVSLIENRTRDFGECVVLSRSVCGVFAAGYDDGSVVLWDSQEIKGTSIGRMKGRVSAIAINSDGSRLIVAGEKGDLKMVDIAAKSSREVLRDGLEYGTVMCAVWNEPRGEFVYGGEDDRVILRGWKDGKRRDMFSYHESHISDIIVVEDSIITCGWDGNLVIWRNNGQAFLLFDQKNCVFYSLWYGGLYNDNLILYAALSIDVQGKCLIYRFEIEKWRQT